MADRPILIYFRGATAYEMQVWRIWFRWTHLRGAYWRGRPWRRLQAGWDAERPALDSPHSPPTPLWRGL